MNQGWNGNTYTSVSEGYWTGMVFDADGRVIDPGVWHSYAEEAAAAKEAAMNAKLDTIIRLLGELIEVCKR